MALMTSPDSTKSERASDAMLQMVKFDMAALQAAFDGKAGLTTP